MSEKNMPPPYNTEQHLQSYPPNQGFVNPVAPQSNYSPQLGGQPYAAPPPSYPPPPQQGYAPPQQGYAPPQQGYAPPQAPPQTQQPQSGGVVVNNVINQQPTSPTVIVQSMPKPPNYMALSICTLICCNLPLGIVAVIFANMSDSAYHDGNVADAASKGRIARNISICGMLVTIIIIIVWVSIAVTSATTVVTREINDINNRWDDY